MTTEALRTVSIVPEASALVESLRGLGYSTETALADLLDNSISANASRIEIDAQWKEGAPVFAVLDDGEGMDEARLAAALRFGGDGPSAVRDLSDLGRFGMGLKTASLSQCRRMTIVSRRGGQNAALVLDIDVIGKQGWVAVIPDTLSDHPLMTKLAGQDQGTLVLWEQMDARSGLTGLTREIFFLRLAEIRAHLSMVFQRFLSGDARKIVIAVNERALKPWDPFQRSHTATKPLGKVNLRLAGKRITVRPFVLPHRDRFANDTEYADAGGPGGWGARQGFYIYRGDRLLVAGSWLGLGGSRAWTREEASRLARIEVDLPTDLDDEWRIDVRKSQARPPGELRARLTDIAGSCRNEAREVFAFRGRRTGGGTRTERVPDPVWQTHDLKTGTRYAINRKHPAVLGFAETTGISPKLLSGLFTLIEQSVPVERIWLDVSDAEGAPPPAPEADAVEDLAVRLAGLRAALPKHLTPDTAADLLLANMNQPPLALRNRLLTLLEGRAA